MGRRRVPSISGLAFAVVSSADSPSDVFYRCNAEVTLPDLKGQLDFCTSWKDWVWSIRTENFIFFILFYF